MKNEVTSPAFQFYVRDWIISTRHLSPESRCAHIDLLSFGWEGGGIPDDLSALAAMCAMTPARFRKAWSEIQGKWPLAEDGRRRNPRQESQRQEMADQRQRRAEAGRKGGLAKGKQ
jgi:uncharacterized protein YdaU (DUF1376 family)